jgi:hypothetical protein
LGSWPVLVAALGLQAVLELRPGEPLTENEETCPTPHVARMLGDLRGERPGPDVPRLGPGQEPDPRTPTRVGPTTSMAEWVSSPEATRARNLSPGETPVSETMTQSSVTKTAMRAASLATTASAQLRAPASSSSSTAPGAEDEALLVLEVHDGDADDHER